MKIAAKIGTPSHLEFVSSHGHKAAQVETIKGGDSILEKVNDPKLFSFMFQYVNSKLLEMWVMKQIAPGSRSLKSSSTLLIRVCAEVFLGEVSVLLYGSQMEYIFKRIFGRSADEGSQTLVSAVAVGKEAHGGFWTNDEITA